MTLLADAERQFTFLNGGSPAPASFAKLAWECGWSTREVPLPSGISHGLPWGFSLATTPGAPDELRWLVEPQATDGRAASYWRAGMRVAGWLADRHGASLDRLRLVEDLFVPDDDAPFRIWFGVEPSLHKVYLSLRASGGDAAVRPRLEAALHRLGHPPPPMLEGNPTILSLDLAEGGRIKIYSLLVTSSLPDELAPIQALVDGRKVGWLIAHAPDGQPVAAHLSILRHPVAHERVEALAGRPIPRLPLHFVSYQLRGGRPRTTIYFLPERAP